MTSVPPANSSRRRRQTNAPPPELQPSSQDESETEPEAQLETEAPAEAAGPVSLPIDDVSGRTFQELFDAIPPEVLRAATEPLRPDELIGVCMDDRNPDDGVYSAGGFVLLDPAVAVEQIRRLGVTALRSHPGCGAGAVLALKAGLPRERGDGVAIEQSTSLAALAGISYAGASAVDPDAPHKARAALIFVDLPARRSILRQYLPPAFYMSGDAYPDREALISDALLSVRIGLQAGDERGEAFSGEKPFSVVMVGRDKDVVRDHASVFRARMQAVLPVNTSECIRVATVF